MGAGVLARGEILELQMSGRCSIRDDWDAAIAEATNG
jgi:hypothetical protein